MKVDIHAHFYPLDYLGEVERLASSTSPRDQAWLAIMRKVRATPTMWSVDERLGEMEAAGVDMQVLSLSIPNVYFEDQGRSRALAESTNESLAALCRKYPQRFKALASVPLPSVEEAIGELRRAILHLGLHGVVLGSNINGRPLDSPQFTPFYEEVARLGVAIFVHPMIPAGVEALREYALVGTAGFLLDTTVAAIRMTYSGLFERYQSLRVIIPHLGGVVPYIVSRIDNAYHSQPECRLHISQPPSHYLKRLYMDTVSFHLPALRCALETVGVEQIVLGSDYPFVLGSMKRSVESVKALGLTAADEERVFSKNLQQLLR